MSELWVTVGKLVLVAVVFIGVFIGVSDSINRTAESGVQATQAVEQIITNDDIVSAITVKADYENADITALVRDQDSNSITNMDSIPNNATFKASNVVRDIYGNMESVIYTLN